MKLFRNALFLAFVLTAFAQTPIVTLVANVEGENRVIAPNTWVEVKGSESFQGR